MRGSRRVSHRAMALAAGLALAAAAGLLTRAGARAAELEPAVRLSELKPIEGTIDLDQKAAFTKRVAIPFQAPAAEEGLGATQLPGGFATSRFTIRDARLDKGWLRLESKALIGRVNVLHCGKGDLLAELSNVRSEPRTLVYLRLVPGRACIFQLTELTRDYASQVEVLGVTVTVDWTDRQLGPELAVIRHHNWSTP